MNWTLNGASIKRPRLQFYPPLPLYACFPPAPLPVFNNRQNQKNRNSQERKHISCDNEQTSSQASKLR